MSTEITVKAGIEPDLYIHASVLKFSQKALIKTHWGLQVWSFVTQMLVVFGLAGTALVAVTLIFGPNTINAIFVFLPALPIALGIWYLYHRKLWHTMYTQILASPIYDRKMIYRFDQTGFAMSADGASWTIIWALTDDVISDEKGLYLFAGGLIYPIPAAAFGAGELSRLASDIDAWREAAAQGDAP